MTKPKRDREAAEAFFWAHVTKGEGCWLWGLYCNPSGYGSACVAGIETKLAHRIAMILTVGPLKRGTLVCHRCDNPRCVRPDHMFLGSQKDNMADMAQKRRGTLGPKSTAQRHPERLPRKLTIDQVKAIRASRGLRCHRELATEYGVTKSLIHAILAEKIWRADTIAKLELAGVRQHEARLGR